MFRSRTRFGALAAVLATISAMAGTPGSGATADLSIWSLARTPLQHLQGRDYATVQHQFARDQRLYATGAKTGRQLHGDFRALYSNSPRTTRRLEDWVHAFPRSYVARVALGANLFHRAWRTRADAPRGPLSPTRRRAIHDDLQRAQTVLLSSLRMSPRPYLSAFYLLDVAILTGSRAERRHWLQRGERIDPSNALQRQRYFFSLQPRWGGSYAQMRRFLRLSAAQHVNRTALVDMQVLLHADLAADAMRSHDSRGMLREWGAVLALDREAGLAPSNEALMGFTRGAWDLGLHSQANWGLRQLSHRSLSGATTLAQVGWMYAKENHDRRAWPYLVRAAREHDAWAQFAVGNTIRLGCPQLNLAPNPARGLVWIERSARHCFPSALRFLAANHLGAPRACTRATAAQAHS